MLTDDFSSIGDEASGRTPFVRQTEEGEKEKTKEKKEVEEGK